MVGSRRSHRKRRGRGALSPSEPTNPHLCRYCGDLFDRISYIPYPGLVRLANSGLKMFSGKETEALEFFCHWPDFETLRESASNGCHLCSMFLFKIHRPERNFLEANPAETRNRGGTIELKVAGNQREESFEVFLSHPLPTKIDKSLDLGRAGRTSEWEKSRLKLRPSKPRSICNLTSAKIRADISSMCLVAESWISTCIADHGGCTQQDLDMSSQPARLIAVGVMEDFSDVRLCSGFIAQPQIRYMTLSHCWGPQGLDYKLKSGLEADFFKQIPWQELPQTFKDAIIFTRRLGKKFAVEHIWIDALCILQDSDEDWRRQSSVMGDIYGNSFCNLAACVGNNSHHGLFPCRNPLAFHDCIVRGGPNSSKLLQNTFSVHGHLDRWDRLVEQSGLLGRAWVFQELFIAPRVLYFTSEQLFWDCSSLCAEEPAPEKHLYERGFSFSDVTFRMPWDNPLFDVIWSTRIVSMYTKGDLTYASDRLPAISGVARQMLRFTQGGLVSHEQYVAGLWRRNLHLHMLWQVFYRHAKSRPDNSYAPTWSWASVQGQIINLWNEEPDVRTIRKALATIIAVDMEYITDDPFGQVKSGLVRIRAPLLQSEVQIVADIIGPNYITKCNNDVGNFEFDTFLSEDAVRPLFCLGIVTQDTVTEQHSRHEAVGLLLEKVPDTRGRYRRCGLFTNWRRDPEFVENPRTSPLSDIDYEERHGDGTCTISII